MITPALAHVLRFKPAVVAAPAYTGPGDVEAFTWWGGFRAYSAATVGTKAIRVRAADTVETDINTLSDGTLDAATLAAFIVTHGACTVKTIYDKVGTNDATQATAGNQPALTTNGPNGSYCVSPDFAGSTTHYLETGSALATQAQPYATAVVAKWISTSPGVTGTVDSGFANGYLLNFTDGTTITPYAGSNANVTVTSTTVFAAYLVNFNGASSHLFYNGTDSGAISPGTATITQKLRIGDNGANQAYNGHICEVGYKASAISNTSGMNTNMRAAYGGF